MLYNERGMVMKLCNENLNALQNVITPNRAVLDSNVGMLHIGLGNFFRAHQAIFTQKAIDKNGGDWSYVAATLSSEATINKLKEQDFLYTCVSQSESDSNAEIIAIIKDAILLKNNANKLYDYLQAENIKIITLTITEKGYYFEPSSGNLLENSQDIIADIANNEQPKTVVGILVNALRKRKNAINKGLTILSCDNLPNNGKVTKNVVLQYAQKIDAQLAAWIEKNVTFPCSMVDRITPSVSQSDIEKFAKEYGYQDEMPIFTEEFCQWVIEDDFPYGRPAWEQAGVQMSSDVASFEEMKLRLLNGTHSTISYLGYLAGFKTVDEFIGNEDCAKFIRHMMDKEITPTLHVAGNVDINAYKDKLISRYKNPHLFHQTYQIAMDGSQKIPQRIINPLKYQYENNGEYDCFITCIAAWLYYIGATDESGNTYEVKDPFAAEFAQQRAAASSDDEFILAILSMNAIFADFFINHADLVQKIVAKYHQLKDQGILNTIKSL